MAIVLYTERLTLRRPTLDDLDAFAAQFADPAVTRYLGDGSTRPRERVERGLRNGLRCWERHGYGPFTITHKDEIIGDCMLYPIARSGTDPADFDARGPEVEVGYRLARTAWGRGFATEATAAAIEWATSDTDGPAFDNLIAVTHPDNAASQRVLVKLGMRRIGLTDAYYDTTTALYTLDRRESCNTARPSTLRP